MFLQRFSGLQLQALCSSSGVGGLAIRLLSSSRATQVSSGASRSSTGVDTAEAAAAVTASPSEASHAVEDAAAPLKFSRAHNQLVDQFIAAVNSGRRQQLQQRKIELMQEYARADGDVGSPEVQIALLTDKIRDMSSHFMTHRKDYHSMRGLQGMLNQRRKLLAYLRRDNFPRYAFVLHKLGLKDTYAKQERYDKYRVGSRLGTPAEALKRYGNQPAKQLTPVQRRQQQKQQQKQQEQQRLQQQKMGVA